MTWWLTESKKYEYQGPIILARYAYEAGRKEAIAECARAAESEGNALRCVDDVTYSSTFYQSEGAYRAARCIRALANSPNGDESK